MATVYSLACFGGLSGKTVTFTDAGDVVNLTNHGLRQGVTGIVFSTTGTLPTGIVAGTTYYPRDGADANKFTIYPTKADALAGTNQVTFSGAGSGTHTVKSAYMLGLTTEQKARYGSSGNERIYDGIIQWKTQRSLVSNLSDSEICEIGEIWDEITTSLFTTDVPAAYQKVTTKVDGVWGTGFHNGIVGGGYRYVSGTSSHLVNLNYYDAHVEGIEVVNTSTSTGSYSIVTGGSVSAFCSVTHCIINGNNTGQRKGISTAATLLAANNIVVNCLGNTYAGLYINSVAGARLINNIVTKCAVGIGGLTSTPQGVLVNNISVGNTMNYASHISLTPSQAFRNMGETKDKVSFTVTAGSSNLTFSANHERYTATTCPIVFHTTGTLPTVGGVPLSTSKVYWVKGRTSTTVITIAETPGGTPLVFDGTGTGTHSAWLIWTHEAPPPLAIDFTIPGNLFVDWANNDFRPASASSPQVDAGLEVSYFPPVDIKGAGRPNYEAATYPNNYWDVGPFEYDHGDGLAPLQVTLSISGMAEGSVMAVYKISDGTPIISPTTIGASGSYSTTYSYTGDTQIEVVVRKGSSGTKYLPYSAPGLITSTGFSLIVNQVVDGLLNG